MGEDQRRGVFAYTMAVAHEWRAWVTSSAALALVGIVLSATDVHLPWWVWLVIVASGMVVAQFKAYEKLRIERDKLRKVAISDQALASIAGLRKKLTDLLNEGTDDDAELLSLRHRYEHLRKEIGDYISENISIAEAEIFYVVGTFSMPVNIPPEKYEELKARHMMIRDIEHLKILVSDFSRNKRGEA